MLRTCINKSKQNENGKKLTQNKAELTAKCVGVFNQAGAKRRYPWIFLITVLLSRLSSRQLHSVRFQRVCFCLVGMRGQVNAKFFVLIGKFGQISSHLYNVVLGHWSISTDAFTEGCCCFYRHLTEYVEPLRWFSGTCQLNIHVNDDLLLSSVKIFSNWNVYIQFMISKVL